MFDGFVHNELETQAIYGFNLTEFSYRVYPQKGLQSAWNFHMPNKATPFYNTIKIHMR